MSVSEAKPMSETDPVSSDDEESGEKDQTRSSRNGGTKSAKSSSKPSKATTIGRRDFLGRKQRFEARRVRRVIRHIDPWSVLKASLVFFVCVWIMFMVAVVIIWSIAQGAGTVEKLESFVNDLGVTGWRLDGTFIFRQYGLFGLVMVFACTAATVISTVVFNLISDLVGGIWISVIEEETSRPVSN